MGMRGKGDGEKEWIGVHVLFHIVHAAEAGQLRLANSLLLQGRSGDGERRHDGNDDH